MSPLTTISVCLRLAVVVVVVVIHLINQKSEISECVFSGTNNVTQVESWASEERR